MSWASELPGELLCRPTGLVVLTGLDITYNAIHKAIWDCFCNNRRPDRVPLQFKVLNADHEYPKCRSKRTSYEWYIPKGMVKTAWMRKHLEEVPSVVVIFFDLDWDENMWKERQMECATKVEIVRNSLLGRSTRVAVVLIQKTAPLPPGEDVVAAERAASLCSACELSAKSLFVLPHTDHLLGYTIRLENAFYELAQSYYHTESRRVKAHKEFLNKTTHQLLFVRHQFKIAFYNELKQDTHTALKHYKQAYGHILDLRMHDTNLLEIKTIAGFINYKICRLSFQHNAPLDAIGQFRKHIDFFKARVGVPDLAFEHSAWMGKQFQVFGDLFDEAIKLGLTAIQTQHPGFYYQQAANHVSTRRTLARQSCTGHVAGHSADMLELLSKLDYYGQRPWRQGHQSIDPPDAQREKDGIQALQALEGTVEYSWIIIPLLSSAVAQFKKYKSPRMKRYLMVEMGEEYYHSKDYNKALTLLNRVTWDYRNERWWPLLTNILFTSLRCAYLVANVQEYVTICLELIGKYTVCSKDEKIRMEKNLIKVINNMAPEPEPGCPEECVEKAKHLWAPQTASPEQAIFSIDMHNIIPFIECKACFVKDSFTADSQIILKVFLRSSAPFPIGFSKLAVLLSNQAYNQHCVVSDSKGLARTASEDSDLYMTPAQIKVHTFSFLPQAEDVGRLLEITSVALEMGSGSGRCAILHWTGGGGDAVATPLTQVTYKARGNLNVSESADWHVIPVLPVTRIEPRVANMEVTLQHEPPSLVNEFYRIKVTVKNEENTAIEGVKLAFGLKEDQGSNLEQSSHLCVGTATFEGHAVCRKADIILGDMEPGQSLDKLLYMKNLTTGDRIIFARVSYSILVEGEKGEKISCSCHRQQTIILPTINPLEVTTRLNSLQCDVIESVHADEPFLLLTDIKCTSPWPIVLHSTKFSLSDYVQCTDEELVSQIEDIDLKLGECASECHCLVAPPAIQPTIPMGSYVIQWKRDSSGEEVPYVSTVVNLPGVRIEHIPLYVDVDMPATGSVRSKLPVTYNIHNRTPYSQEIEINMESAEAFMFSGHKQFHFRVLPNACYKLSYALYPLIPGQVLLPKLHLNMLRYPGTMDSVVSKMLPTHVYVKPSGRHAVATENLPESLPVA